MLHRRTNFEVRRPSRSVDIIHFRPGNFDLWVFHIETGAHYCLWHAQPTYKFFSVLCDMQMNSYTSSRIYISDTSVAIKPVIASAWQTKLHGFFLVQFERRTIVTLVKNVDLNISEKKLLNISQNLLLYLLTPRIVAWVRRWVASHSVILWVCLSLYVCVCPHDKTKTAETKITKLVVWTVYHDTSLTSEY